MTKKQADIFPALADSEASQLAYGDCPKCASPLQIKHVGKNSFVACTAYPACDYSHSLTNQEVTTLKTIDDSHCPQCNALLAVKKGRYGMFIGCTNFPDCHFISSNQLKQKSAQYTPVSCPSCTSGLLQKKQNRFGKFFYACDNYPKCKYVLNQQPVNKTCPACNASIMLRKGKDEAVLICAKEDCAQQINESE